MGDDDNTGAAIAERLAGRDLNKSGKVINLAICGNSRFYNYEWLEEQLEQWMKWHEYPDLIILGGASGVDYLAERWADNYGEIKCIHEHICFFPGMYKSAFGCFNSS